MQKNTITCEGTKLTSKFPVKYQSNFEHQIVWFILIKAQMVRITERITDHNKREKIPCKLYRETHHVEAAC